MVREEDIMVMLQDHLTNAALSFITKEVTAPQRDQNLQY